jgi:hypothetical protein
LPSNEDDIFPEIIKERFVDFIKIFCGTNLILGMVGLILLSPMANKKRIKKMSLKNSEI